ncbi:MAG: Zn-ribbon domain-containing OB-fold protein [Acidimicrobiales bacterium]
MTASGPPFRLVPRLDQENRFFWTSGADGQLRFLRCSDCRRFVHPPSPVCPECLGRDLEPEVVSGRATVASFTVNQQQWIPGSEHYVIAWVAIEEQPDIRLTTNLVQIDEDAVEIGMPVRVVFEQVGDDVYLPLFAPQTSQDAGVGAS